MRGGVFVDGDWVETKNQNPAGGVRLTQLADIGAGYWRNRSDRYMTENAAEQLRCTFLLSGDVLIARMPEPLGRACIFPGDAHPCVTAVDVCICRPDPKAVDANWLMWSLNAPQARSQIAALQSGTTRKRISRKNLARISLPMVPLEEQRRIVAAIEQLFSRLDAAEKASLRADLGLKRMAESAFMSAADFGSIGHVPLGEIAEVVGGVTKDGKKQSNPEFVTVPYLRVANVQRGFIDLSSVATIRVDPKSAEKLRLERGDILFNEGGDRDKLGRGWIWEDQVENCIHQNHVFRARVDQDRYEPRFISYYANTIGRRWFERMGRQTTNLASLSMSTLKVFPIPSLPLESQRELVALVESRSSLYRAAQSDLARGLQKCRRLRQAILAEAFMGRLRG